MIFTTHHTSKPWQEAFSVHNQKVEFLDTLAILMGFRESFGAEFPDGKRPDVLRVNSQRKMLFIGDGKNTESPGNSATRARLLEYLRWFAAHIGKGRTGVFSICFGKDEDTDEWIRAVYLLGLAVGVQFTDFSAHHFDNGLNVVWFVAKDATLKSNSGR